MPLRVIGYVRVSTKDQGKNGYDVGAQHDSLRQFCDQHGHELLTVTSDVVSGADSARMYGREVAITAIEMGVADALLVRALDRATRSQLDHASLFERAQRNAWRLTDCDGADSGDPSQRLTAYVRNPVAAEERRKISERTREGLAKARKQGKRLGRPPQIDTALARRIVRMSTRDGLSPNKIARRLTDTAVPTQAAVCAGTPRRERAADVGARGRRSRSPNRTGLDHTYL
jgi:DNA invertase Pin-like site-specific DNA recombinase